MIHTLDHPQLATPAKTDRSTSASFVKGTLKQNRSKSWDMCYHWLIDQSQLDNFLFIGTKSQITMLIIILSTFLPLITKM